MDAKKMREKVQSELSHIPRGNEPQNNLRLLYWTLRMSSLGKKAKSEKTKEDVLIEAIDAVRKEYPDFKPRFDSDFFNPGVPTFQVAE